MADQPDTTHLRLTIDVHYKRNGVPVKQLRDFLEQNAREMVQRRGLAGYSGAEVDEYEINVKRPTKKKGKP